MPEYHHFVVIGSSDPKVIVDQVSNLSAAKGTVLLLGLLFLQTDPSFEVRIMDDFCSVLKAFEIPLVDDEDFKSSTESAISTSLIHCIASVGNCEQVQYLGLEPYLPYTSLVQGTCQSEDPKSAVVFGLPHNSLKSLLH